MVWIKDKINRLLSNLILNHDKNLKRPSELDGFEFKLDLPMRNLGVNAEYFRKNEQLTFEVEPEDRIKTVCPTIYGIAPSVAIIRNVYLVGGHNPFATTSKFTIVYDSIDHEKLLYMGRVRSALAGLDFKTKLMFVNKLIRFFSLLKTKRIDQAVLLTNGWTHYGHWLLEHITKVRYVREFQQQHKVNPVFILEKDAPAWQYYLLEILNIRKEQTVQWNGKTISVDKFILPSYPEWNFDDYDWLRKQIFSKIQPKGPSRFPRIYLSRKNCDKRIVRNEDQLVPLFEKYGIQILYPEDYCVQEQIEIFMGATFIIGPNGSAFANIIFSSNPLIIEFHGQEIRRTAYKLSKIMGFTYLPFYCDLVEGQHEDEIDKYLYVNPDKLEKLLMDSAARELDSPVKQ